MDFEKQRIALQQQIIKVNSQNFDDLALEIFAFQAEHNPVYAEFLALLKVKPAEIKSIDRIPFLPISLFKNKTIKTGKWMSESQFFSSGTTDQVP